MIDWLKSLFTKDSVDFEAMDDQALMINYKLTCLGETGFSLDEIRAEVDRRGLEP